ncbi:hypothetical protein ADUPG1_013946 [Aduncisulcus paluster]|uniref:VWFA domain-containing protein n=1 Tax=Aduncisulcus paluster TaxID=2918883 RepID=A0ABQ5K9S9_9EUKA|nr:hypothetical protein ADUPG1_013946 [Aduncisulcus paluster]
MVIDDDLLYESCYNWDDSFPTYLFILAGGTGGSALELISSAVKQVALQASEVLSGDDMISTLWFGCDSPVATTVPSSWTDDSSSISSSLNAFGTSRGSCVEYGIEAALDFFDATTYGSFTEVNKVLLIIWADSDDPPINDLASCKTSSSNQGIRINTMTIGNSSVCSTLSALSGNTNGKSYCGVSDDDESLSLAVEDILLYSKSCVDTCGEMMYIVSTTESCEPCPDGYPYYCPGDGSVYSCPSDNYYLDDTHECIDCPLTASCEDGVPTCQDGYEIDEVNHVCVRGELELYIAVGCAITAVIIVIACITVCLCLQCNRKRRLERRRRQLELLWKKRFMLVKQCVFIGAGGEGWVGEHEREKEARRKIREKAVRRELILAQARRAAEKDDEDADTNSSDNSDSDSDSDKAKYKPVKKSSSTPLPQKDIDQSVGDIPSEDIADIAGTLENAGIDEDSDDWWDAPEEDWKKMETERKTKTMDIVKNKHHEQIDSILGIEKQEQPQPPTRDISSRSWMIRRDPLSSIDPREQKKPDGTADSDSSKTSPDDLSSIVPLLLTSDDDFTHTHMRLLMGRLGKRIMEIEKGLLDEEQKTGDLGSGSPSTGEGSGGEQGPESSRENRKKRKEQKEDEKKRKMKEKEKKEREKEKLRRRLLREEWWESSSEDSLDSEDSSQEKGKKEGSKSSRRHRSSRSRRGRKKHHNGDHEDSEYDEYYDDDVRIHPDGKKRRRRRVKKNIGGDGVSSSAARQRTGTVSSSRDRSTSGAWDDSGARVSTVDVVGILGSDSRSKERRRKSVAEHRGRSGKPFHHHPKQLEPIDGIEMEPVSMSRGRSSGRYGSVQPQSALISPKDVSMSAFGGPLTIDELAQQHK